MKNRTGLFIQYAVCAGFRARGGLRWGLTAWLALLGNDALAGGWANLTTSPTGAYLGDTPTLPTQYVDVQRDGNPRNGVNVVARQGNADLSTGASTGAFLAGSGSQNVAPTAPQATSTGTWHWGLMVEYQGGSPYKVYAKSTGWTQMTLGSWGGNAVLNYTVSALGEPSGLGSAADAAHPATRIDLDWTRWSSRNVLIVRSTASAFTAPTQGSAYATGNTLGSGTVIYNGSGTATESAGLLPGTTYYYRFYSENFSYYSPGAQISRVTEMPRARNTSGGSPQAPASTIYLGDQNLTFGFDSWGQLDGNNGRARLWIRHNNADLSGGAASDWTSYASTDNKTRSSPQFNQTGTWYWGFQADYNTPYGDAFWYKASNTAWTEMAANGNASTLSVTVNALNNPSGQTATQDGTNPSSQINLGWTKNAQNHDVIILRKTSLQSWTEPTQGTSYAVNDTIGSGVVVYKGSATSLSNTGLAASTTYDYKFYSLNNNYYSAGVTAQASTAAACVLPSGYSVTGGGAYCSGGSGVAVGLANSESGVTYQLYRNGGATAVGSPVAGTGSAISFGDQTVADTYTAIGTRTAGGCTSNMTGSATVTIDPVSVGGTAAAASSSVCSGNPTTATLTGHTGSIQWQQSNDGSTGWANVSGGSGGTSATYTTPNLTSAIFYRALVTSGVCAPATSTVAGITVVVPASITTQPSSITACDGTSTNFTVTGAGDSLSYRWRKRASGWGTSNGWTINAGSGGVFIGSSDINTGGNSWGMFNTGSTATEAIRSFGAMSVGDVFEFDMDNGSVNSGGTVGFSLRNGSSQNMVEFYFLGGSTFYKINRSGGGVDTTLSFTSSGLRFTLTVTSSTTFSLSILASSTTYGPYTGTFLNTGSISQVRAFSVNNGSGGSFDLFFNSLKIGPAADAPFYDDNAAGYSTWTGNPGNGPVANGGAYSGATTASLSISPATNTETGSYDVVVYNSCDAVLSSAVTLSISPTPSITTASPLPQGSTGTAYSQTLAATGGSGFSFGVTSGTLPPGLTLASGGELSGIPTTANTYNFTVGVTNSAGCTATKAFALTLISAAPGTPASDLTVTATSTNTLSLSWTRGNGDNVLIVGRQAAAAEAPSDATTYSASNDWTAAGSVGSASKALYIGTGTSVTLTNLTPGTQYQFSAYEFNGSAGSEAYRVSGAPTAIGYTYSTQPANHGTAFNASNPSASTIDLAWTASAGSPAPDGYLVLRRLSAAPTAAPADGVGYSVGQTVGDSVVAAIVTSGTSATASGLAAQSTYYFALFPFRWNGTNNETRNYKTDDTVPTDFETTLAAGVIVDHFTGYTGGLNGKNGGTGWTNAWVVSTSHGSVTNEAGSLNVPSGFPDAEGDKVTAGEFNALSNPSFSARRGFNAFNSGRIYASATFRYDYSNPNVYLGLSLMQGATEKAFAGRPFQNDELLGLDSFGGGQFMTTEPFYGGNTYQLIVMYDFDSRALKALIYNSGGGGVPESEPGTWIAERTVGPGLISSIDGIRISGGNNFGFARFDEVHVSDTWAGLLQLNISDPDAEPTIQTSQFQFDFERKDRFTAAFQRGNGSKVLILARQGSAVTAEPVDGVTYTANATFGSGTQVGTGNYVVFDGDATSFDLLGLSPDTEYHLRAFEYNEGSGTKYLATQVPGNPGSYRTLAPPSSITVGLAGTSATDLAWQKFNNRNVMIVYRVNNAVSFTPSEGSTYTDGQNLGDGNTVLRGSIADLFLNHSGLTPGSTVHYRFFSVQGSYYSEGVNQSLLLAESAIIYDGFANSSGNLNGTGGGTGWAANWTVVNSGDAAYVGASLPGDTYALPTGNKSVFYGDVNGRFIDGTRMFQTGFTTGKVVISWLQNHANAGTQNYAGVRLLDQNTNVVAFVGKRYDDSLRIGESSANAAKTDETLANGVGADYIYVVRYDFETRVLSASAYRHSQRLTWAEPPVLDIITTQSVGHITSLSGLRLSVGANAGNQIGFVYYDEIRAGTNWTEVVRRDGQQYRQMMESGPTPELIFIGPNYQPTNAPLKNFVTDAELANSSNSLDIAVRWTSPNGVFTTNNPSSANSIFADSGNFTPNWDPLTRTALGDTALGFDAMFQSFVGTNGASVVTSYHANAFTGDDFGSWSVDDEFFVTVSAQTYPPSGGTVTAPSGGQAVPNRRAMTVNLPLQFFVLDDDTNAPSLRGFSLDAAAILTDQDLRDGNFTLTGEVNDAGSGVDTNELWFTLINPDGWAVRTEQPFSTRPDQGAARTNFAALQHPVGAIPYLDNRIGVWTAQVYAGDADADRANDMTATNRSFPILVTDDDTFGPTMPGTVVYDPFTDGNAVNTTGGDAFDIPWYLQGASATRSVVPDPYGIGNGMALRVVPTSGGTLVGPAGVTCTLSNDADSVSFSFQMRLGTNVVSDAAGFRFGIYQQAGLAVGADYDDNSEDDFGYYVAFATGNAAPGLVIGKETGSSEDGILTGADTHVLAAAGGYSLSPLLAHLVLLRVDYLTNGVQILLSIDGSNVLSVADTSGYYTNFNAMAFRSAATQDYYLDDIAFGRKDVSPSVSDWTNSTSFTVEWDVAGVADESGLSEFRITTNGAPPADASDGVGVGLTDIANVTILTQGRVTNYIFGVDNDNDRPQDGAAGLPAFFVTLLDTTRPAQVTGLLATNDLVADPQSMVQTEWSELTDFGGQGADPLSPFQKYRVYYWVTNASGVGLTNHQEIASGSAATDLLITNLAPGVEYDFAVSGYDRAGNEGPLGNPFRFGTQPFFITNGVALSSNTVRFKVRTAPGGNYDLLRSDAVDYGDYLTNFWTLAREFTGAAASEYTFTNEVFTLPQVGSEVRFFRAAPRGRWARELPLRSASKEIYVVRQASLRAGQNWVAFPAIPDSNRVDLVLGTYLPSSGTLLGATRAIWYERGLSQTLTNQIWLLNTDPPRWTSTGSDNKNDMALPLQEGFIVRIPDHVPAASAMLVGRLPLTNQVQTLAGNQAYNLISARTPQSLHPSNLFTVVDGTPNSGRFTGGQLPIPHPLYGSDMLWKFNRQEQRVSNVLYYNTAAQQWLMDTGQPVPDNYFQPDDAVIYLSGRSTVSVTVTNAAAAVAGGSGAKWSVPTINITP